jgi:LemA protein
MIPLLIILAVILTVFLLGVTQYNRLVRGRQMTQEGLSGIDVQLKRRADLIPNLLETVKGYMGHERQVLERVTELRTKSLQAGSVAEKGQVEGMLTEALRTLFAVAENYPDLKASQNFMELQQSLADIEEQIQLSRRYYNGAARNLNILVESFPSNIVARIFGFTQVEYFELEDQADRAVPRVSFS